jgi:hypothetical protein
VIARATAFVAVITILLGWDIVVAGRAVQRSSPSRSLRLLSGFTGFLVAPALLVHYGAQSVVSGRVLSGLSWIGPLVFLLCAVQAACAWWRREASPALVLPLLAFDVVQFGIAGVTYAGSHGLAMPHLLMAPAVAQADLFARAFGTWAFASPLAIVVPLLAPVVPSRGRGGARLRMLIAVGAAAAVAALAAATPSAIRDLNSYSRLGSGPIAERGRESFTSALSILPELTGTPSAANLRDDLALADTLDVGALLVRVAPGGARAAALDSLARALEPYRRDSTLVLVAIDAGIAGRRVTADRVMRRLRPDYLVLYGTREPEPLARIAALAHRLRPATRVAVQLSPTSDADSVLFDWATSGASPVDGVVFSLFPAKGGASPTLAALATAERWMRNEGLPREHWLLTVGAPSVEGEEAQRRLFRHAFAWGTARSLVQGVVLGEAADYAQGTGLRAVNGRLRAAVADAASAIRTLNETTSPPVP